MATHDSVAFRFLAANQHPDYDTIASFRKTFLLELQELFVQVLAIAQELKLFKLGNISLDGTKIKANASKHYRTDTLRSWKHSYEKRFSFY